MRTTLTTASVVALLATGAGSAAARPIDASGGTPARPAQSTAQQALLDHEHGGSRPALPPSGGSASAPIVHVTRVADGGFAWADAGIGAGLAAALLLSAAGASALRRQPSATR